LKYTIKKITNIEDLDFIYTKFIQFSPQKSVFTTTDILKYFFEDLDIYIICKNDKIKSFIYLLKDKEENVVLEPFIYSGILNQPKLLMKNSRYNNEVFKLNQIIVNDIFAKYRQLNINLPLNFSDIRPFLWFNYGEENKRKFKVYPCFTSILDINSKEKIDIFNEIDDVKRRDIKKVLNNEDYKISNKIDLSLMKKFYKDTMDKNQGSFDKNACDKIFDFMETQVIEKKLIQVTTYYLERPIYSVLFLNNEDSSCYLYGSGDVHIKNRYAGTICLWKAIEESIDRKLKFIDLEGINSPFRGEFKLSFGGNIAGYFNVTI